MRTIGKVHCCLCNAGTNAEGNPAVAFRCGMRLGMDSEVCYTEKRNDGQQIGNKLSSTPVMMLRTAVNQE